MNYQNFAASMVTGVVASLLSVFITTVAVAVWRAIIIPWYEERLYKGPEIKGAWETSIDYINAGSNRIIYYLSRQGINVKGYAHCHEGPEKGMFWTLTGEFKNLILNLNYQSKSNYRLDRGSLSVMLSNNGSSFKGHICYYSDSQNMINSVPIKLVKVEDDGSPYAQ